MPIHDWTKVDSGIFHHFHQRWIGRISDVLNDELLPEEYYVLDEQRSAAREPDVLALRERGSDFSGHSKSSASIQERPKTRFVVETDAEIYAKKKDRAVVRRVSDDRIIAIVEVLSPGNKSSKFAFDQFLAKAFEMLNSDVNLLLLDLFPPTKRDPRGLHAAIWEKLTEEKLTVPKKLPLNLVSYEAGDATRGYFEPVAVGQKLPNMPLFLEYGWHVSIPLEKTYEAAYRQVPRRWRKVIEESN